MSEHATPALPEGSPSAGPDIHVERWEGIWIRVSLVVLAVFTLAVTVSAVAWNIRVPGQVARVDPNNLDAPGSPFAEPGLREISPGNYEAWMTAQAWMFTPNQITVPQGSKVTFYITSKDIQHGFKIVDTNANVMVLPGQVSRTAAVFKNPGTYNIICHEYCGIAHQTMYGQVIVTPAGHGDTADTTN